VVGTTVSKKAESKLIRCGDLKTSISMAFCKQAACTTKYNSEWIVNFKMWEFDVNNDGTVAPEMDIAPVIINEESNCGESEKE